MAYNKFQHGVPVAWIITERWETPDIALVLKVVEKAGEEKRAAMGLNKKPSRKAFGLPLFPYSP